jgi:hypothetical protein
MLVDNKFIFVSLPRSASTSFYITCLKKGIKIEHYDTIIGLNKIEVDTSDDNEYISLTGSGALAYIVNKLGTFCCFLLWE